MLNYSTIVWPSEQLSEVGGQVFSLFSFFPSGYVVYQLSQPYVRARKPTQVFPWRALDPPCPDIRTAIRMAARWTVC